LHIFLFTFFCRRRGIKNRHSCINLKEYTLKRNCSSG
jgi:hypothetical protein